MVVEFNLTNFCNLYCKFCPLEPPIERNCINVSLFHKAISELQYMQFSGLLAFSGFCEPLLHPNLEQLIIISRNKLPKAIISLHSNGIELNDRKIKTLKEMGIDYIIVSAYSKEIFNKFKYDKNVKIKFNHLKKKSNRAGALFKAKTLNKCCYYPFYSLYIDWNGDVLFCPHNFYKYNVLGNLKNSSLLSLWNGKKLNSIRSKLAEKNRNFEPCCYCNIKGTLMGKKVFKKWKETQNI